MCRGGQEGGGRERTFSREAGSWLRGQRWGGCPDKQGEEAPLAWSKSGFLENFKEMVWSLFLLVATLTFTEALPLFAFLFPVCASTGYFYLQHCRAVGPMQWVKACETL